MQSNFEKVAYWMALARQEPRPLTPTIPPWPVMQLRYDLIYEELNELWDAMQKRDLVAVADALADLEYVVLGAFVTYGLDEPRVFSEVHRSNMTKLDGGPLFNDAGKLMKGPHYDAPRLREVLGL